MLPFLLRLFGLLGVALTIGAALVPHRVKAQLPDKSGSSRTVPFELARGTLPLPAAGERILTFIQAPDGRLSTDMVIRTHPGAVVVAPCDGDVLCTGECRSYGIYGIGVIIDAGDGYHMLLEGLALVKVEFGQRVSAGQPIGTVHPSTAAGDAPILRVELRKDGQSVDSAPWWRKG